MKKETATPGSVMSEVQPESGASARAHEEFHKQLKDDLAAVSYNATSSQAVDVPVETMEIHLPTASIAINPKFADMRQNRNDADYKAGIKRLAEQLKEPGGQKQPATIRTNTLASGPGSECSYELVAGHRRYEAAKLAGVDLLCKFEDMSDEEAIRWARRENFSREDFSPMEKARIIVGMRVEKMKTKDIAEELGVSTATVTQTEKLLNAAPEVQRAVDEGVMTMSAALEADPVVPAKLPSVMKKATQEAEKEAKQKAAKAGKGKAGKSKQEQAKKKVKVEGKHIRQAIKAVKGAVAKHKAPNRAEIVGMLQGVVKRADCMPIRGLCQVMLAWISGSVADGKVKAAFGELANCIPNEKRELPTAAGIAGIAGIAGSIAGAAVKKVGKLAKTAAKPAAKPSAKLAKPSAATHRKPAAASAKSKSKSKPVVKAKKSSKAIAAKS